MIYTLPSGRQGYCYLSPESMLTYKMEAHSWHHPVYGHDLDKIKNAYFSFVKHQSKATIYVQLKDVKIHSKQKEMVMRILYGL